MRHGAQSGEESQVVGASDASQLEEKRFPVWLLCCPLGTYSTAMDKWPFLCVAVAYVLSGIIHSWDAMSGPQRHRKPVKSSRCI